MVVVSVNGGLGNQLFQYAFGKSLAHLHRTEVCYDLSAFENPEHRNLALHHFNCEIVAAKPKDIPYQFRGRWRKYSPLASLLNRLFYQKKVVLEKQFHFNSNYLENDKNGYYWGYWQSEKYFIAVKEDLLNDLSFKIRDFGKEELDTLQRIETTNSVCLHVRRGDYVNNYLHPLCELTYYQNAIELLERKVETPLFFIFSDDIEWCKKNIRLTKNFEFVNTSADWRDLRLMTYCKHNIIANSSFSWWGAYLGSNKEKIVVSPKQWFSNPNLNIRDLKPNHWISI